MSSAPTTPSGEILTRTQVLTRFLRETGLGISGTLTGGSISSIIDTTRLQSPQFNTGDWVGGWCRISNDAGSHAAPETQIRAITSYQPASGTINVSPNWTTTAPSLGMSYQLFRNPHPTDVLDALDAVLTKETWLPCTTVLSMCPDADMEQSHTTDWTGTNATVAKSTTAPALMGKRWLSVLTTSAAGYAESAIIRVEPGSRIHVSALVRATAAGTTATLTVYDKTNSAAIGTPVTSVRQQVVRLWTEISVPSTCYQITIRLSNAENSVTSMWDEVAVYPTDTTELNLPWWVGDHSQVKAVYQMRMSQSVGANVWDAGYRGEQDNRWDIRPSDFGPGPFKLVAHYARGLTMPIFIIGTRPEEAYANDNAETKHLDGNWMQAALAYKVFDLLGSNPNRGILNMDWIDKQRTKWEMEYEKRKYQQAMRLEQLQRSPGADGLFYRNGPGTELMLGLGR